MIIEHLPVVYRPSILRSLALTCHRIHDVVFPELTYDSVWLVGEDQALTTLNMLTARAELVTAQDIQKQGNPSPSHCIHHICLDSSIKTPTHVPNSLDALQKLLDVDGLRHLSSLTLRVDPTGHLKLFFTSLETKCPNLKKVRLSDFSQEFGKEWIEPYIFSIKVNVTVLCTNSILTYPLLLESD